jgi:hypothetical protein
MIRYVHGSESLLEEAMKNSPPFIEDEGSQFHFHSNLPLPPTLTQLKPLHNPVYLTSILLSSSHLRLVFTSGRFLTEMLYACFYSFFGNNYRWYSCYCHKDLNKMTVGTALGHFKTLHLLLVTFLYYPFCIVMKGLVRLIFLAVVNPCRSLFRLFTVQGCRRSCRESAATLIRFRKLLMRCALFARNYFNLMLAFAHSFYD